MHYILRNILYKQLEQIVGTGIHKWISRVYQYSQMNALLHSADAIICEIVPSRIADYLQIAYISTISHFYCGSSVYKEKLYPIA